MMHSFSFSRSGGSRASGAMEGREDLSPDRLEKLHVRNARQRSQHSRILVRVSWRSGKSKSHRRGVQERAECLGSHLNLIANSRPRKIPCLRFLISEMGRVILASSLSQRNNSITYAHLGTKINKKQLKRSPQKDSLHMN